MFEIESFKKCFDQKRVIWVKGPHGCRQSEVVYEMLAHIDVPAQRVCKVSAHQFVEIIFSGTAELFTAQIEVLMIQDFEDLSKIALNQLLNALKVYVEFKQSYSFCVILFSTPDFIYTRAFEETLKPLVIRIHGVGEDPNDLDERFHSVLHEASRVTQKKVKKLTVGVADWVEKQPWVKNDEQLLEILIAAQLQMGNDTTLRMDHFIPILSRFAPNSQAVIFQRTV